MHILYTFFLVLYAPFVLLKLWWRAWRAPAYRQRIAERFAYYSHSPLPACIWVHAVSFGESVAAIPLIKQLRDHNPKQTILVTCTTPTGSQLIQKTFANNEVVHCYMPYDLPWVVKRFLAHHKPCAAIMIETEIWPNIIAQCHHLSIPIIIANARMADRSAARYMRLGFFTQQVMGQLTHVLAQTQADADRFARLGVAIDQITVTGSMKFDLSLPDALPEQAKQLRAQWGVSRRIFIIASTHEGEEAIALAAFAKIKQQIANALLVIVPRHPERFATVAQLSKEAGYRVVCRSQQCACDEETDVFIGDSMGEMLLYYAASDVAAVGGSWAEIGGHNTLEPAALGLPVIVGPHTFHFVAITALLQDAGGLVKVPDGDVLAQTVIEWLQDPSKAQRIGEQGRTVVARNRGALQRQLLVIQAFLGDKSETACVPQHVRSIQE